MVLHTHYFLEVDLQGRGSEAQHLPYRDYSRLQASIRNLELQSKKFNDGIFIKYLNRNRQQLKCSKIDINLKIIISISRRYNMQKGI